MVGDTGGMCQVLILIVGLLLGAEVPLNDDSGVAGVQLCV